MRHDMARLVLILSLLALLAGVQVWVSQARYEMSRQSKSLTTEYSDLRYRITQLRLERSSLIRPERLRRIARDQLGMAPPKAQQVVRP
ncbi:MAG: cell division protein FtsL [Mariprofundales bacterium]|nr:cell division protein FtsL [Mariprofundales bacterium]